MSWLFSQRAARRKMRKWNQQPNEPLGCEWLILLIVAATVIYLIVR